MKKSLYILAAALASIALYTTALAMPQSGTKSSDTDSSAASPLLTIGSKVPPIEVAGWAKGTPVKEFDPSKLYVVEFWATWCGPCKESIPHLTELAKQYKGKITFVGVSAFENNGAKPTDISYQKRVLDFVASMGDKMDYNVAYDTPEGSMAKTWMDAAAQMAIPTAFVIKNDDIVWIGHPMNLADPLQQIIAGTYDENKFAVGFKPSQIKAEIEYKIETTLAAKKYDVALALITSAEASHPELKSDLMSDHVAALFLSGQPDQADSFVKANVAQNPDLYIVSDEVLLQNGKTQADFDRAVSYAQAYSNLKVGSNPEEAQYYLAITNDKAGHHPAAMAAADAGLKLAGADKSPNGPQIVAMFQKLREQFTAEADPKPGGNAKQ